MKEAISGGTGRNCVVVEARRCAKGTQPPGTVGFVAKGVKGTVEENRKRPNPPYTAVLFFIVQRSLAVSGVQVGSEGARFSYDAILISRYHY